MASYSSAPYPPRPDANRTRAHTHPARYIPEQYRLPQQSAATSDPYAYANGRPAPLRPTDSYTMPAGQSVPPQSYLRPAAAAVPPSYATSAGDAWTAPQLFPPGAGMRPRGYSYSSQHSRHSNGSHRSHCSHCDCSSNSDTERERKHHHHHQHRPHKHHHHHHYDNSGLGMYDGEEHRHKHRRHHSDSALKRVDTSRPTMGDTIYAMFDSIKNVLGGK